MKLKKIASILAATAALGVGSTNVAHAGAYGYSYLNITNLFIFFDDPDVLAATASFDSSADAFSTGYGSESSFDSSFGTNDGSNNFPGMRNPDAGGALSSTPGGVSVGDATYAAVGNNQFDPLSGPVAGVAGMPTFIGENGGRGDSVINRSTIVDGGDTDVQLVAEGERSIDGSSVANGTVGSTTSFEFDFDLAEDATLTFLFQAESYLKTILHDDATGFARADYDVSFEIKDNNGAVVFSWSPDGIADNASNGGDFTDSYNLNDDIAATDLDRENNVDSAGDGIVISGGLMDFGASVFLNPGTYTLALSAHTGVNMSAAKVPEPAVFAMMGMGLLGMGFQSRKKRMA